MSKKNVQTSNKERLQKVLARAGVASRRASETLIQQGRVVVNGQVVTELGTKVDPRRAVILVDGQPVTTQPAKLTYIILNKPRNVLSSAQDERGRKTVLDLVDVPERIYPVGRLDWQSEGLLLLTNDGDLTKKLTHPSHKVEKEYQVLVRGVATNQTLRRWKKGNIEVDGRPVGPAVVERLKVEEKNTWLKIILTEGRKRQIREVARALGHPVIKLTRVRLGSVRLGRLKPGKWRHLKPGEVQRLKESAGR